MNQDDRRVQRTRSLLQRALMELIREKGYDSVTIQEIVDRANVGRATFYLHFQSKDALFISSHLMDMEYPYYGILTREELLGSGAPQSLIEIFRYVKANSSMLRVIVGSKDGSIITRQIKRQQVENIETSLKNAFPEAHQTIDTHVLANYLGDAHFNLMTWWIESRAPQSAEEIATICHRLQRAAICEAFGLPL
jgi:AcrR family transcriptional regulator